MPAPKQSFVFSGARGVDLPSDARAAHALEFIAHYLDRIDAHLERLAAQVEAGQQNGARIVLELQAISRSVGEMR